MMQVIRESKHPTDNCTTGDQNAFDGFHFFWYKDFKIHFITDCSMYGFTTCRFVPHNLQPNSQVVVILQNWSGFTMQVKLSMNTAFV